MNVFVVNLDQDAEKLTAISVRLKALGIDFERFPAVCGKCLPDDEKRRAKNRFRLWCSIGRPLQDGELGCALSHLGIYRRMCATGMRKALVLEDDVLLDDRLPEQMNRVEEFLCLDVPRVVLLSDRTHAGIDEWMIKPAVGDFGTFAYAINYSAAAAIIRANYPVCRPCDHWRYWRKHGLIELYHAYPTVCDYDHAISSSTSPKCRVADLPLHKWVLHKMKRAIGKSIDKVLPA